MALVPFYIFWLDVNFDKSTIGLHFLFISFILAKFTDQRSIIMSLIKYLNFKFFWYKIMHQNKFINQIKIISDWYKI